MATYFISDLHLGASYLGDTHAHQRRVVEFLHSIAHDATDLYLLGDILDYWYEYRTVVPRGYTRFFGALAELADRGVKIHWFIGNHDIWLFDYLRHEIGIEITDGSKIVDIEGKRFYLAHGDGVGRRRLSFRIIRSIFRNRFCQLLYASIHPRWTVGFAHWWSCRSRGKEIIPEPFENADEPLWQFATEYEREHPGEIDYFVFGHRHAAAHISLPGGAQLVILGDWITADTYGVFHNGNFELKHFESKRPSINII